MNLNVLRQYAQPGDFVLIGGNKPFQRLIQYGQRGLTEDGRPSLWSHVMLVYDKRLFIESTVRFHSIFRIDNGVQFSEFEDYRKAKRAVLVKPVLSCKERDDIIDRALELESEGVYYSVAGLFWSLAAYYILGRFGKRKNYFDQRGLYCSAFVQNCYSAVGIDFTDRFGVRNTAPEHLWQWAVRNKVNKVYLTGG